MGWDRQLIFGLPLFRDDGDFFVATNNGNVGPPVIYSIGVMVL